MREILSSAYNARKKIESPHHAESTTRQFDFGSDFVQICFVKV
jgi:hypothetical protein